MKKLLIYWIIGIAFLGSAGIVHAEQPFVLISATPDELDLGTVFFQGKELPETLKVEVQSNCLHGSIVASVTPLESRRGGTILPGRVSI